jgi:PAS domain S-box-containing protein
MKFKEYFYVRGVGAHLAFAFSALSIILTLVLVEIIGVAATEQLKLNIGYGLGELAYHTSNRLDRGMFERYREVQLMAQRSGLTAPGRTLEQKRGLLEKVQETYPYYAWIGLTDADGKVLVSAQKMLEGADVSERPWFINALKEQFVGDVHEAKLLAKVLPNGTDEPLRFVDLAFPYRDGGGKLAGVLGVHLSWQWAKDLERSIVEPLSAHRKVQILIVSKDGEALLGPPDLQGKKLSVASLTEAQRRGNGFNIETWPDGKDYLVGFSAGKGHASYRGLGWTVLLRQSVEDAYLPARLIQQRVFWSGIAIAVLFSLLGLFAARRISHPLRALAEAAQRIEKGDAVAIPPNASGYFEIKALTGSLNSLVTNLLQKESALKELNLSLEKRVEQRTQAMERALAVVTANEIRIQTILNTAQDAFIGVDLHDHITDWNSQAERMFGWTRDQAMGRQLSSVIIPERSRAGYRELLRTFRETGKGHFLNQRLETTVMNREGEKITVEVTVGLAGTTETYFFSIFLHDISDRKAVERMKNEFISTVSHELRTPMTSIRGSLGLLIGGAVGEIPPQAKSLLDIANKNCERLVRMINDMLDLEKIESGNMHFDLVTQALRPLVEQAIESTHGYAAQFNVRVELQCDAADTPVTVDRDRMIQVLVNLLSNAIKFSPAGELVEVRISKKSDHVRLEVVDHGRGIPEEFRGRIFQKFAQVDSTDARDKTGTGLGLSICKCIVEEHQGRIGFRSAIGGGSEFHVELPIAHVHTYVSKEPQ